MITPTRRRFSLGTVAVGVNTVDDITSQRVTPNNGSSKKSKRHPSPLKKGKNKEGNTTSPRSTPEKKHKAHHGLLHLLRRSQVSLEKPSSDGQANSTATQNDVLLMDFLMQVCPEDLVAKVLAYAGPRKAAALSQVNREWNRIMERPETWRILCEDLYKWKPGQPTPSCWKKYYHQNPCVPVDFDSIQNALDATVNAPYVRMTNEDDYADRKHKAGRRKKYHGNVRVLLRPGRYYANESILIDAAHRSIHVSIETMELPRSVAEKRQRYYLCDSVVERQGRACLISRSNQLDEPLIMVVQGQFSIRNVALDHKCRGRDIWNGNAAIHVCASPREATELTYPFVAKSKAVVEACEISSASGRGLVALDRCRVEIRDTFIHHCAATGVYVGGESPNVTIDKCDLVYNGLGNKYGHGIASGHSGIYVEKGYVSIVESNISHNSSYGVSVRSLSNSTLSMNRSDVVSNHFDALDFPDGFRNRDRLNLGTENKILAFGVPRPRSSVLLRGRRGFDDEVESL